MKFLLVALILHLFTYSNVSLAGTNNMDALGKGDVRYLGFLKVYEATLYALAPFDSKSILDKHVSKCLQLEYSMSLSAADFILAAKTILARQQDQKKLDQLQPEIDLLHGAYQDVKKGDRYRLCYQAQDRTTTLAFNDRELVAIPSADFASVYFGIWLGPNAPIDEKLRNDLLKYQRGQSPGE